MIIDFHTHIFPDKIAKNSIKILEDNANIKAYTLGTCTDLRRSMKEGNIDISVVLPIATKIAQFDSINNFAKEITNKDGLISFGSIHPDDIDYKKRLDIIKSMGLKGIKFHPDYQQTYIDDKKYIDIIQYAMDIDLIVSIHGGLDIGKPDEIHCTPKRVRNMLDNINGENKKIIIAHMGGYDCWDDTEKYLVGEDVYLDTSFALTFMDKEQFRRIVKNHGVKKILFASDSPWTGQKESVTCLETIDLTDEEKDMIYYKNALAMLNLTKKEMDMVLAKGQKQKLY